ncbi:MAG TPA: hypothetical protein VFQ78_12105 [Candidatus Udaeobacter sp.]|nr:hypothetical protein [Candidatus Udaeobacter sp.]
MKDSKQTTKLYPLLLAVIGLFMLGAVAAAAAEESTPPKKSAVGFSFELKQWLSFTRFYWKVQPPKEEYELPAC